MICDTPIVKASNHTDQRISRMLFRTSCIVSTCHPLGVALIRRPIFRPANKGDNDAHTSASVEPQGAYQCRSQPSHALARRRVERQTCSPHSRHTGTPVYAVIRPSCATVTAPLRAISGSLGRPFSRNHSEPQCWQRIGSSAAGGNCCRRRSSKETTGFMRGGEKVEKSEKSTAWSKQDLQNGSTLPG